MVVQADGSKPAVVASDVLEVTDWTPVDWSPDGSRLAFSAMTTRPARRALPRLHLCQGELLLVADLRRRGGRVHGCRQVGDPDMDAREAVWSPDGSTIAFGAGDAEAGIGLYLMDSDGSHVRRLGEVTGNGWGFLRLGWSADGSSIVGTAGEVDAGTSGSPMSTTAARRSSRSTSGTRVSPRALPGLRPRRGDRLGSEAASTGVWLPRGARGWWPAGRAG